jgi:holo-[acyl-carrier protein] synthase
VGLPLRAGISEQTALILGIGVDITEISRIKRLLDRKGFAEKIFTPTELASCGKQRAPETSLAGRFAAKEAVMKAIGTGWAKGVSWQDITITNDSAGKPLVELKGQARRIADQVGITRIHVSISHSGGYAVAQVVAESTQIP